MLSIINIQIFNMLKQSDGSRLEVGIDEAGRGCLAGPVVAAAVIMPLIDFDEDPEESEYDLYTLRLIKDSKKMTKKIEIFVANILKK